MKLTYEEDYCDHINFRMLVQSVTVSKYRESSVNVGSDSTVSDKQKLS